ncbi:MAG: hypothetical protein N3D10_01855 [Candidatus Micrarchaeota archaeon]|nr:hypothetical protein [Candidatus Micrarchaeota archaeon]
MEQTIFNFRISFAKILLIFLILCPVFFSSDIVKKEAAVLEFVNSNNLSVNRLDHFVGFDSKEYVLVYVENSPYCLLVLEQQNGSIAAQPVTSNKTIEEVLYKRFQTQAFALESVSDFLKKFLPNIDKYLEEIKLKELKYSYFTGLTNSFCSSAAECKELCLESVVCSEIYKYNSSEVLDSIVEFSDTKKAFSVLLESEKAFRAKLNEKTDEEILNYYINFLDELEKYSKIYSNLKIQSNNSLFYAGELSGSLELLNNSKFQLSSYHQKFLKNSEITKTIEKIKENTNLFKKEEIKNEQELVYTKEENPTIVFKTTEQELPIQTEQESLKNASTAEEKKENIEKNILGSLDLIFTIVAVSILLYALVRLILVFISKKSSSFDKKEKSKLFSIFFGKKKERTLEDL